MKNILKDINPLKVKSSHDRMMFVDRSLLCFKTVHFGTRCVRGITVSIPKENVLTIYCFIY